MITVKQMERAWNARQYERLYRDLLAFRPEATLRMDFESGWAAPAAAMALIRMDELSQSHLPLFGKLLRALIATQQQDGGWGDVTTTALCLRASVVKRTSISPQASVGSARSPARHRPAPRGPS